MTRHILATLFCHSRVILPRSQQRLVSLRHASSASSNKQIPPESPKFIDVPQPPQQEAFRKREVKGVLPVPRQIFPRRRQDKTSPEYLEAVIPEPKSTKSHSSKHLSQVKEFVDWKSRLAATRRKNLRDGLRELHRRKEISDRRLAARTAFKQAEHERRIHEPEREDERLTNPSIIKAMTPGYMGMLQDPDRDARIARKRMNYTAKENEKMEERRNALHSLYMNARDFIVTEGELNARVDEAFDDAFYKRNPGRSVWDKEGFPYTVERMIAHANKNVGKAIAQSSDYAQITRERVQRIAEELTGGKM